MSAKTKTDRDRQNPDSAVKDEVNLPLDNDYAQELQRSSCPVESTLEAIGGRWKVLILKELFEGVKRFGQLNRALQGITQKMLTQQLREMEKDGLVNRRVYRQVPPKVEYSLTPMGETLKPILNSMHEWGIQYLSQKMLSMTKESTETNA